ncbi:hypothetical protein ABZS94_28935 [Streptomyces sp. NPDC005500]|uniref:hypothetical protein n=1 Tax=Streptomyces sp. NPDC005500 TaxID=3155007 RepID=UPI0033B09D6F
MLLLINAAAHEPRPGVDGEVPTECVGVVRAQVRLQKLDFWVRYPDYLAYELMTEYEKAPDELALLDLAENILSSQEPDLRRFPMLRHRFGAFEELTSVSARHTIPDASVSRTASPISRTGEPWPAISAAEST